MLVLGIESSTPIASVALVGPQGLVGEITLNIGLTHSEQLLPLIVDLLEQSRLQLEDVGGIAIAGGPGSFTGLRIGMATAKALAQGRQLPLVAVPTLEALAYTQMNSNYLISPVMNARKKEVYTALFRFQGDNIEQIEPDQAIDPAKWVERLNHYGQPVLFIGDGALIYREQWSALAQGAVIPPAIFQGVRASTVAQLGRGRLLAGERDDLYSLKPFYLRPVDARKKLKCAKVEG